MIARNLKLNVYSLIATILWSIITGLLLFQTPFIASFDMYSKLQLFNESNRAVYFHDTVVVTVEREKDTEKLLSCEMMDPGSERENFVKMLEESMGSASEYSLDEIWDLMEECEKCNEFQYLDVDTTAQNIARKLAISPSFFDALDGIVPGTFWCGAGSLARNYHDLGADREIDKCCRRHDVCPEKILAHENKFNLQNDSSYTKSHCKCDDEFAECLKRTGRELASTIGDLYFNIAQMDCLIDVDGGKSFRGSQGF